MSIAEFIREAGFLPRLKTAGSLVVYDPDRLYQDIRLRPKNGQGCRAIDFNPDRRYQEIHIGSEAKPKKMRSKNAAGG